MFNLKQGEKLIKLARDTISSHFTDEKLNVDGNVKKDFGDKQGVFVTLTKNGELRGCIGFAEPVMVLCEGVVEAAKAAAFQDPRFSPLERDELKEIDIEVSVLSKPELIKVEKAEEYMDKIQIGRDGLVIRGDYGSGLLLPQVAPEWGWNVGEFLENTCRKAGMDSECWKDLNNKLYSFRAQIFSEEKGQIVEKK